MSYTPLANEVVISGLDIGSGGQTWAGETVIIPLNDVSDPSQFYVKSATDGSLIKVDPATAAQLYATSIAINDLNSLYGPGQAYSIPSADWAPIANYAQTSFEGESLLSYIEDFVSQLPTLIPEAIGLAIPDIDVLSAAGIAETLTSTYLTAATNNANNVEFALADSLVNSASTLLSTSFYNYNNYIYDYTAHPGSGIAVNVDQPVDYSAIYDTLYNTLVSIDTGEAASSAISRLANGSLWNDLVGVAETALGLIPGQVGELIGDVAGAAGLFQAIAGSPNVNQFATNLQALITAAENTALSSFPLSSTAIANDETELANSIAETQGEVLGTTPSTETPTPTFVIVSSPTVSESAAKLTFTIDETGALSQNLTVYVSTIQNWDGSGVYNTSTPGSNVSTNYYYDGLNTIPITFAATSASSSSQQISIAINPVGLTSGSETFGFEVQQANSNGQLYTVTSTPFTIENQPSTTAGPTISSITSSPSSGSVVTAGHSVTFTVTFSAPVTVNLAGGLPLLTLNDNEAASYTGGSGTNALTFVYNVSPGDQASDLQVTGLTIPNGSGIANLAGTAAVTTGATENTGLQINTAAPTVTITTTGGLVAEAAQTISGTVDVADAGTTVTVYDGANNIGTATVASNGT
jgi:hypothetical protein